MTDTPDPSDWLTSTYAAIAAANNNDSTELRRILTAQAHTDYDLLGWGDLAGLDLLRVDSAIDASVNVAAAVIFGLIGWNDAERSRLRSEVAALRDRTTT